MRRRALIGMREWIGDANTIVFVVVTEVGGLALGSNHFDQTIDLVEGLGVS